MDIYQSCSNSVNSAQTASKSVSVDRAQRQPRHHHVARPLAVVDSLRHAE